MSLLDMPLPAPDTDELTAPARARAYSPAAPGPRHAYDPSNPPVTAAVTRDKPSNPKDAVGIKKVPMSCVPAPVIMETALGMMEGALKYGRHNYRSIGVRASVYYDATMRHLMAWWEGEDTDPDSAAKLSHVSKAIASLTVLRDAMINGKWEDDRPPVSKKEWLAELNRMAEALLVQFPEPKAAFTQDALNSAEAEERGG